MNPFSSVSYSILDKQHSPRQKKKKQKKNTHCQRKCSDIGQVWLWHSLFSIMSLQKFFKKRKEKTSGNVERNRFAFPQKCVAVLHVTSGVLPKNYLTTCMICFSLLSRYIFLHCLIQRLNSSLSRNQSRFTIEYPGRNRNVILFKYF